MSLRCCVFFILFTHIILAQETIHTKLNGKINAKTLDLDGVYVINLNTERSTITENGGYFSIAAKPGDSLLFSAINLKRFKIHIKQKDFEQELFVVNLELSITQLNEVIVKKYPQINAFSMGIISKPQKMYTPAERKLYTATSLNPSASIDGSTGGSVSMDPLLNWMSGRTKMLKKELEAETKLGYIQQLEKMFNQNYFVTQLKIPSEYVNGFKFYAVENDKFTYILKSKNKTSTEFLLGELANQYLELNFSEKE